jgi:hypothetical protein
MGGFSFDWLADAAGVLADFGGYSSSLRLFHMMKIPFHKDETMLLLFARALRGAPGSAHGLAGSAWFKPPACQFDQPEACPTRTL